MTDGDRDDVNPTVKHSQVVSSRSTEHLWHASVTCHKIDQISRLRQCKDAVRWQTRERLTWNGSRGLEGISFGETASRVLVPLATAW